MTNLYSFSQVLKTLPLYKTHRDSIQQIYIRLASAQCLNTVNLQSMFQELVPDVAQAMMASGDLLGRLTEDHVVQKMKGVQHVVYGEELYPVNCYYMADPPLTLSYLGAAPWLCEKSISVVGSREPSAESLRWMEKELSEFCDLEKPMIVSGGARGVDQKAHSVALRKACPTVVVLPSGLGELYPASLQEWVEPILAAGGCLLSEYDYSQKMHKHLFYHRNRLIAALGVATLVVEAKRRSGTLITAQQAAQLGRAVWIVPGHPQDPHFAGCLDLLAEGADMIRDAQDLSMFFHSELMIKEINLAGVGGLGDSIH